MRFISLLLLFVCSCIDQSKEISPTPDIEKGLLDSIRIQVNAARILLHHPIQKKSLVCREVYTRQVIDSLFSYIEDFNPDTTCLTGGFYNYFGQINFYRDSLRKGKVAELYFVLEGNCAGFYLKTENYLRRYGIKKEGRAFISDLYNTNKHKLVR